MVPAHVLYASFLQGVADALVALLIQEIFTSARNASSKICGSVVKLFSPPLLHYESLITDTIASSFGRHFRL